MKINFSITETLKTYCQSKNDRQHYEKLHHNYLTTVSVTKNWMT